MIKIIQRYLRAPNPSSNPLEQARQCVGVHQSFSCSKTFAGGSLNAFCTLPLSLLTSVSNIHSHSLLPICRWRLLLQRHSDFTVPVQLLESLRSGDHGSDWSLLLRWPLILFPTQYFFLFIIFFLLNWCRVCCLGFFLYPRVSSVLGYRLWCAHSWGNIAKNQEEGESGAGALAAGKK